MRTTRLLALEMVLIVAAGCPVVAERAAAQSQPGISGGELEIRLHTGRPWNIYWGEDPVRIRLVVRQRGQGKPERVRWQIRMTDLYADEGLGRRSGRLSLEPGKGTAVELALESLRRGLLRVDAEVSSDDGRKLAAHAIEIGNYLPAVCESMRTALDVDWMDESVFGGAFGQFDRRLADMHGARWCRISADWRDTERKPGRYDWTGWGRALDELQRNHIRPVALAALSAEPTFHADVRSAGYAPAYGRYLFGLAREFERLCRDWELGNEVSDDHREVYPEVARHGASGVRRADPLARVIVGGTALVDSKFHQSLNHETFADFDAACVHPHCRARSPEEADLLGQCRMLQDVIDSFGGWHDVWSIDCDGPGGGASPLGADERRRARHLVRRHLLSIAGGVAKHGLSSYEGDSGIYNRSRPSLAAAASHTMIALLEGHRYVGPLRPLGQDGVYLALYERNGRGTLVGWRIASQEKVDPLRLELDTVFLRRYDLMGNTKSLMSAAGDYAIDLDESPSYWVGVGSEAMARAAQGRLDEAIRRLEALAGKAGASQLTGWTSDLTEPAKASHLDARLRELPGRITPVAGQTRPCDMAAVCQALRTGELLAYLIEASDRPARNVLEPELFDVDDQRRLAAVRRRIELLASGFHQMHRRDHTIPMLRWIIRHGRRVLDDAETARRYGRYRRVGLLARVAEVYVAAGAAVFNKHRPATRCVWITPYVGPAGQEGRFGQAFIASAGKSMPLRLRVNSYALREHRGLLVAVLPKGWSLAEGSGTGWRVKTDGNRPTRVVRDVNIAPMTGETYALVLGVAADARPGRREMSLELDVPTLTVAPRKIQVEVGEPLASRPKPAGSTGLGSSADDASRQ
ncbi:MAG: hypothetical protein JXQ73_04855 [Phycisphaerae bacterium]|nr:hypothetical protein [Phycisphaerae bacterium]